jgi:P2-related tail formation protein
LSGEIKEWFEYGGEPYKFKVDLGAQDREITPELRDKLIQLINTYKNERSWLEEIILAYLTSGYLQFATTQLAETESDADFQSEFEWLARATVPFAISTISEVEAIALMET